MLLSLDSHTNPLILSVFEPQGTASGRIQSEIYFPTHVPKFFNILEINFLILFSFLYYENVKKVKIDCRTYILER